MAQTKIDLSKIQAFIGDRMVAFAESSSINFDKVEEDAKSIYDKTFPMSFERSAVVKTDTPLVPGMLTYEGEQPVQICIDHTPKRIPRKIKKALRSLWLGRYWQQKAGYWYSRNYYTTKTIGCLTSDENGNVSIQSHGPWQDSRHPNEMVMSREATERLNEILNKDFKN